MHEQLGMVLASLQTQSVHRLFPALFRPNVDARALASSVRGALNISSVWIFCSSVSQFSEPARGPSISQRWC